MTVGANGTLHAGRIRRVNLRGTRVCSLAPSSSENIVPNRLQIVNYLVVLISAACQHLESLLMYTLSETSELCIKCVVTHISILDFQ